MAEFSNNLALADDDEVPKFVDKLRTGKAILFKPRGPGTDPDLGDGTVVMVDPVARPPKKGEMVLVVHNDHRHVSLERVTRVRASQLWLWSDSDRAGSRSFPLDAVVGIARLRALEGWPAVGFWFRRVWLGISRLWKA